MSGFGGVINKHTPIPAAVMEKMQESLKSLGTDNCGTYISQNVCLIHTGYNFENSRQPVRGVLGRTAYFVVLDGELYNKTELRRELITLGYRTHDDSDANVVLHGYMAWGKNCVERFIGAYAFAVWDETGLFIARDRLGIKPLYFSENSDGLVFASSLQAVLSHPNIQPQIDENGILELIMLGPARSPGCAIFANVKEIAPGECAYYTTLSPGLEINTYWRLKAKIHQDNYPQTVEHVRQLVTDSVNRHGVPQGSTGVSLVSGGLDSSIITALSGIKESYDLDYVGNNKHFAANNFQPQEDRDFVEIIKNYLGLNYRRIILGSDEIAGALHPAMVARGLPGMADIDAALLLFLQKIGEFHDGFFAFSGEGADEIFGGYPWCNANTAPTTFPWATDINLRASFLPDFPICPKEYVKSRFNRAIASANTLYDDDDIEKQTRQMFNINLGWFMQNLTNRASAMGTAAKVRMRMPFLDYHLVEYMYNVPSEFLTRDGTKGLLRTAFKDILPLEIIEREKSPFPKTHNPGYTKLVQDKLRMILADSNAPIFSILHKNVLENILENESGHWYGQLMAYPQTIAYFLQINDWMKFFNVVVNV